MVFFSDLRADYDYIDDCFNTLAWLSDHSKTVVLLWIPTHCGIEGNDAGGGASILQLNNQKLAYHSIKTIVKKTLRRSFSQDLADKISLKPWYSHTDDISE